jgi:hypothetical protein
MGPTLGVPIGTLSVKREGGVLRCGPFHVLRIDETDLRFNVAAARGHRVLCIIIHTRHNHAAIWHRDNRIFSLIRRCITSPAEAQEEG